MNATDLLTSRSVPSLLPSQINKFTLEQVRAKKERLFNPRSVLESLKLSSGKEVIGVDIGGDKIISASFIAKDSRLVQTAKPQILKSQNGSGYLGFLEGIAGKAENKELSLGIGFAGKVEDTTVIDNPNVRYLSGELKEKYDSDFRNIYPQTIVLNDAITGLMAGALETIRTATNIGEIIFIVNGTGMNGAVLKNNEVWSMEAGHIEVDKSLNPYNQERECGMFGAKYVCVERVGAAKAGLEDIWFKQTGEKLRGQEIAKRLDEGHELAKNLYDNSALITAHMVAGIIKTFKLLQTQGGTAVVFHGGIFYVDQFCQRLEQILGNYFKLKPSYIYTKNFSDNAGLDGAAIAALTI